MKMKGIFGYMKEKFIDIKKEIKEQEQTHGKKHVRNKILVNLITSIRSLGTIAIIPVFFQWPAPWAFFSRAQARQSGSAKRSCAGRG